MNKKILLYFCIFLVSCTSTQINQNLQSTVTPLPSTSTPTLALPSETNTLAITPTSLPNEITDAQGTRMNLVPKGTFTMGDNIYNDESPVHEIYLDSYYIDIYEVTNAAYKTCVEAGECNLPNKTEYYSQSTYNQHPVVNVDWNMARAYCEWRGARLPTEAEWEKAARGTDGRTYPWGEDISCERVNYNPSDQDGGSSCLGGTTIVGSYENGKSPYGIYDMAGNVWEWASSLYWEYPYNANDGRENLTVAGDRVVRAGSWNHYAIWVRAAYRNRNDSYYSDRYIGFRCADLP